MSHPDRARTVAPLADSQTGPIAWYCHQNIHGGARQGCLNYLPPIHHLSSLCAMVAGRGFREIMAVGSNVALEHDKPDNVTPVHPVDQCFDVSRACIILLVGKSSPAVASFIQTIPIGHFAKSLAIRLSFTHRLQGSVGGDKHHQRFDCSVTTIACVASCVWFPEAEGQR